MSSVGCDSSASFTTLRSGLLLKTFDRLSCELNETLSGRSDPLLLASSNANGFTFHNGHREQDYNHSSTHFAWNRCFHPNFLTETPSA
jgi:hypothetical protein